MALGSFSLIQLIILTPCILYILYQNKSKVEIDAIDKNTMHYLICRTIMLLPFRSIKFILC
jgi:hypothetical protein